MHVFKTMSVSDIGIINREKQNQPRESYICPSPCLNNAMEIGISGKFVSWTQHRNTLCQLHILSRGRYRAGNEYPVAGVSLVGNGTMEVNVTAVDSNSNILRICVADIVSNKIDLSCPLKIVTELDMKGWAGTQVQNQFASRHRGVVACVVDQIKPKHLVVPFS